MHDAWSEADLRLQLRRTSGNWLLAKLKAGANEYHLDFAWVLAVASRETNCVNMSGDGGHGHGPMQLDDRSHMIPAGWQQDPSEIIRLCCALLASYMVQVQQALPHLQGDQILKVTASAYNCGVGRAVEGSRDHGDSDYHTTGQDYGMQVMARRKKFAELLNS